MVYELLTACLGQKMNIRHMRFNNCLYVKVDLNDPNRGEQLSTRWHDQITEVGELWHLNHFPAAYKDLFCMQSDTKTCFVLQLASKSQRRTTSYTLRFVTQVSIVVELVVARSSELEIAIMCWRRTRQLTTSPWRSITRDLTT